MTFQVIAKIKKNEFTFSQLSIRV